MNDKPLLVFPAPAEVDRSRRFGGGSPAHAPGYQRQVKRLGPKFQRLQKAFDGRRALLQDSPDGTVPEMVLVVELSEAIDTFRGALKRAGFEWLDEFDVDDIPPDEDFFIPDKDGASTDKPLRGRVYLTMTDQRALRELESLWQKWRENPDAKWQWGQGAWPKVFSTIRDIRPWAEQDRLRDTGLESNWQSRLDFGDDLVRFEAELWYRQNSARRQQSSSALTEIVSQLGGEVITKALIPEIQYHAILGQIPSAAAKQIIAHEDVQLLQADDVMYFRPTGQVSCPGPADKDIASEGDARDLPKTNDLPPTLAILDGMPIENHELLDGRLTIDDPDGWSAEIAVNRRYHGTCMASLIAHGDLNNAKSPLSRQVYLRPILKPVGLPGSTAECVPEDELPVDLIHRSVRRIFDEGGNGVAPSVRIINLSVGDSSRPFSTVVSPWAKLLDWLAWHYQVLFIVSAGNHGSPIALDLPADTVAKSDPSDVQRSVLRSLVESTRNRRLLAPAESINALTVGSTHCDASAAVPYASYHVDPFEDSFLPSPISAHGLGYKRAIKPDVLIAGGRQIFSEPPVAAGPNAMIEPISAFSAPGQQAAAPGAHSGDLNRVLDYRGTSNSAALVSRLGSQLVDTLVELQHDAGGTMLDNSSFGVLAKALLVHGASWGDAEDAFRSILEPKVGGRKVREEISRYLGYGEIDIDYASTCTDQRATLLGCGELRDNEAHEYTLPLPPSLSGEAVHRRLNITLAWMSPIATGTQKYRRAHLWFTPSGNSGVAPEREMYNHHAVSRGTVQHEIFVGDKATIFQDGDSLKISINCRSDATPLRDLVKYGLAVTVEVAEGVDIPIYEEIRARIRPRVEVKPGI